jgi:hypothetical protein
MPRVLAPIGPSGTVETSRSVVHTINLRLRNWAPCRMHPDQRDLFRPERVRLIFNSTGTGFRLVAVRITGPDAASDYTEDRTINPDPDRTSTWPEWLPALVAAARPTAEEPTHDAY